MSSPLLEISNLTTRFRGDAGVTVAVNDLSLTIREGRTVGLVGESGSGKSVTSLSVMRLLPEVGAEIAAGRIALLGRDLVSAPVEELRTMRGRDMAMIFQEPMTSLNPVFTVGEQVAEAVRVHAPSDRASVRARVLELFDEVGIPDPAASYGKYPHQMSGGQKQRVMIAMALSCNPRLLIADEPTTALDVTIQAQILDLLRRLRDQRGMGMLFITHDLGVIAEIADEVAVMFRGNLVEHGDVIDVFESPRHPYTRGLLACRPRLDREWRRLPTIADFMQVSTGADGRVEVLAREPDPSLAERTASAPPAAQRSGEPILAVEGLCVEYPGTEGGLFRKALPFRAVTDVAFTLARGQTLGLVGESGCGKTTTGRAILRLVEPSAGSIRFMGHDFRALRGRTLREARRHMQVVFQDPFASLDPRMRIEEALTEPMAIHGIGEGARERRDRAEVLLREVGLSGDHLSRFPHEFSGGQRQRICIARALATDPALVICDESVSALDVSVQAQVLNLLKDLQDARGLSYVFVSHDLSVVKFMSDTIAVMEKGRIVELAQADAIYRAPATETTRRLIRSIPSDDLANIRARQQARIAAGATRAEPG
jgi:peptide/nickel transport system ATP-binding protein